MILFVGLFATASSVTTTCPSCSICTMHHVFCLDVSHSGEMLETSSLSKPPLTLTLTVLEGQIRQAPLTVCGPGQTMHWAPGSFPTLSNPQPRFLNPDYPHRWRLKRWLDSGEVLSSRRPRLWPCWSLLCCVQRLGILLAGPSEPEEHQSYSCEAESRFRKSLS